MEQRRKWSWTAKGAFVLAVLTLVTSRLLPKPAVETEEIVERYLLTRVGFLVAVAVLAFVGLYIICVKLRCPHCGAFGLKQIQTCGNCGRDLDAPVEEAEAAETAETASGMTEEEAAEVEAAEQLRP